MTTQIATDLIGKRIEVKPRGDDGDPKGWWTDTRDNGREPIIGIVRSATVGNDGVIVYHIEDDEHWLHVRSSMSNVFRICQPPPPSADSNEMQSLVNEGDVIEVYDEQLTDRKHGKLARIRIREYDGKLGKASIFLTADQLDEHAQRCFQLATKLRSLGGATRRT